MKPISIILTNVALIALLSLSACEHDVNINSTYNADGSLDRHLVFVKVDSSFSSGNYFGLSSEKGWDIAIQPLDTSRKVKKIKEGKLQISFTKHYSTVENANVEMDNDNDTLFHIHSAVEKRYRWFFIYTRYTDTYKAVNRFRYTPVNDFFTREDFSFIDRLPAEGSPISKADSFYLKRLNESIEENYLKFAMIDECMQALIDALEPSDSIDKYERLLAQHKYGIVHKMELQEDDPEDYILYADTLGVPITEETKARYDVAMKGIESRLNFASQAYSADFSHTIQVPGDIVSSNADSIALNVAYWKPAVIKFALRDFDLYVETRSLNYIAIIIAIAVLWVTGWLFLRKNPAKKIS